MRQKKSNSTVSDGHQHDLQPSLQVRENPLSEVRDLRVCLENLGIEMVFLLPNPSAQLH